MTVEVSLQIASNADNIPSKGQIETWVKAALEPQYNNTEISIRIVDANESAKFNQLYRKKAGPTNVLSFPCELPDDITENILGDIILCATLVESESKQQHKSLIAHYAHLIIHGCLHLQGYDHIKEDEARRMEAKECAILADLHFPNPYEGVAIDQE